MKKMSTSAVAGIDIGTNSIRLVDREKGTVFDEPCAVALDRYGQAVAIGREAMDMKDMSDSELHVILPFEGEKASLDALDALLEELCMEYKVFRLFQRPVLLVAYPTAFDDEEVEALEDHLLNLGASQVYCEEQIWVAAIGAELNFNHPIASVVLHMGHSNCDIALFSSGRLLRKKSCAVNGKTTGDLIAAWLRNTCGIEVSDGTIEQIKRRIGNAQIHSHPASMEIAGIDTATRTPKKMSLDENQIAAVVAPFTRELASFVETFIRSLPDHFRQDVMSRGIVCCGGMMNFRGLAGAVQNLIGCPFFVADDPAGTVVNGLKILMNRMDSLPE